MNGKRLSPAANNQAKGKPLVHICVARDGQYMVRAQKAKGQVPNKIFVPWLIEGDTRFFVRNGELIKPYGVVEFGFHRLESIPELPHDRAFYIETARTEFDPTGCVEVKYFDIGKVEQQLNAAQELLEKRFPEPPANGNAGEQAPMGTA
jgi:hypothetical protein